jgi:uncharacterized Zn-finger protein
MEKADRGDAKGAGPTLWVPGFISLAWLAAAIWLGWLAKPCDDGGTFACLRANEWGDYFGGVFAPLALIWLIAAVWIQSSELREQRKELSLTRAEVRDNRAVMEAQADEARRQAEYIGRQTEMLEADRAARETEAIFNAHVAQLALRLRQYPYAFDFTATDRQYTPRLIKNFDYPNDQQTIATAATRLRTSMREMNADHPGVHLDAEQPYNFARIYTSIQACSEASHALPQSSRAIAEALELNDFVAKITDLKSRVTNYPPEMSRIASLFGEHSD